MEWADFKHMCHECEIPPKDIRYAIDFLVQLGDIVYFADRASKLAELVILDSQVRCMHVYPSLREHK
jgi:hypothetical protein